LSDTVSEHFRSNPGALGVMRLGCEGLLETAWPEATVAEGAEVISRIVAALKGDTGRTGDENEWKEQDTSRVPEPAWMEP
jgi:hypothetical protein